MIVDQSTTIPVPPERAWASLLDIPFVATCVPGVESVSPAGPDTYDGILGVKVGPIGVKLEGKVTIAERDEAARRARLDIEATDKRIRGAVNAKTWLTITPADGGSRLDMHTEASILGKLGQFGQAVMKKKADQLLAEFASNLSKKLTATG